MSSSRQPASISTIVLQGLPPKTFVGLDLVSFNSSPSFRGITHLPRGPHFIYTGTDASLSIRHGHWFHIGSSSSVASLTAIYHWDSEHECLEPVQDMEYKARVAATDPPPGRGLVSYVDITNASRQLYENGRGSDIGGFCTVQQWDDLTSHITQALLERLLPPRSSSDLAAHLSPHRIF